MKNLIIITVFLVSSLNISGQTIESLYITPTDSAAIDVNVNVIAGYGIGYLNHNYSILTDTIKLTVCYWHDITGVVTELSNIFSVNLQNGSNDYILDLKIFNSSSYDTCDFNALTDSAIMVFSTPVTDSLFLSVPHIENNLSKLVTIYPNPAHDILHIQSEHLKIRSLALYTPSGNKVKPQNKNTKELILSDLSKGIYILRIKTRKGEITKKVLKE